MRQTSRPTPRVTRHDLEAFSASNNDARNSGSTLRPAFRDNSLTFWSFKVQHINATWNFGKCGQTIITTI